MLELLAAGENLAFVIALGTMVLIRVVEAVGLGSSALGHDLELDAHGNGSAGEASADCPC